MFLRSRATAGSSDELWDELLRGAAPQPAVERALRSVDRALFLTPSTRDEAYHDRPVRDPENGLHQSAPHMYAHVLEALELEAGLSFLNIGSGSGYYP